MPTACAKQCVGRIRWIGYRDDEDGPIYKLVDHWKVALPLHPEWGTKPNVFYVPPFSPPPYDENGDATSQSRVPLDYLESLFGAGVAPALQTLAVERQKKADGVDSELMDTLIGYRHCRRRSGSSTRDMKAASFIGIEI